jgi:hypothetical protein
MIFITYPRSGVNFITKAIEQQTGQKIQYQHSFSAGEWMGFLHKNVDELEDYIINIVRDPKESMASWLSMQYEVNDENLIKNGYEKILKANFIPMYIKMYEKLLSLNNTVFINYKDFNKIDKLLLKLYKILKIIPITNDLVNKNIVNNENLKLRESGYILSSKKNIKYLEIFNYIEYQNLSLCYDLYYKALDRCIKLDNEV